MTKRMLIWPAAVLLAVLAAGVLAEGGEPSKPQAPAPAAANEAGSASWRDAQYRKPGEAALRAKLSRQQYYVTQEAGTEPPFRNAYWDHHAAGIYVDVVSGEPLFSSLDKFDSGTGWPSFTRPIEGNRVLEHADNTLGMRRVEVVSAKAGSHLGHVFEDGPQPTGLRYCINSASIRFVPVDQLAAQGYAEYAKAFIAASAKKPQH